MKRATMFDCDTSMGRSTSRTSFEDEGETSLCSVVAATVGAGLASAAISASAAKKSAKTQAEAAGAAADTQLQATRESNDLNWRMYQQNLTNNSPYMRTGQTAMAALSGGLGLGGIYGAPSSQRMVESSADGRVRAGGGSGLVQNGANGVPIGADAPMIDPETGQPTMYGQTETQNYGASNTEMADAAAQYDGRFTKSFAPSDLTTDPSYKWRLEQGLKSLQSSAAARGGLLTGQTAADINNYAQGAASQEYQAAYDRNRQTTGDLYSRLADLAGVGQTATQNSNIAGQNVGQTIGSTTTQGAQMANDLRTSGAAATAAGQVGAGNAWNSAINNGVNTWSTMQLLNGQNKTPAPYTYDYRGTTLPNSLRGGN